MARLKAYLGKATIASGAAGAFSNVLGVRELGQVVGLMFYSPSAFTGAISVHVGPKDDNTSGQLSVLRSNAVAVALTAATAEYFQCSGFESVACKTAGTEASTRDIEVWAILDVAS